MTLMPLIVDDAVTASTMPTFADLWRDLADNLGTRLSSSISDTVVGGEPGRWALVDALKDDEDERAKFKGAWIYAINSTPAGQQRRVRREGYEGAHGALAVSRVFVNGSNIPTTLPADTTVEVTTPLPVTQSGLTQGLKQQVRGACQRILVRARIPLTGNGTKSYSLAGYSFLTSKEQTDGVYDRRWLRTDGPSARGQREYDITTDGATITLATDSVYGTSEAFELSVLVPANLLVYDGSAWGYSVEGLVNDSDQTAVDIAWVRAIGMALSLDYLLELTENDDTLSDAERTRKMAGYSRRLETRWGPAAQEIIQKRLPRRDPDPPREIAAVTGGRRRRWP